MLFIRQVGANYNRLTLLNNAMVWNGKIPLFAQFSTNMASTDNILMMRTPTMPKQQLRFICYSGALRNSSSNPTTTNLDEQAAQNGGEEPEPSPRSSAECDLAKKECRYGEPPKWLTIKFQQGKRGHKVFCFTSNGIGLKFYNFANVHVPEDVVGFVRAMDELLGAVDENRDKIEALTNRKQPAVVLYTAKATGFLQDFELDLRLGRFLDVQLRTVPNGANPGHKSRDMGLPLRQFHWLRLRIGEMLAENRERELAEQLGEAPRLPAWFREDNFRQSPPNNVPTQQQPPSQAQQPQQSPALLQQLLLQLVLQQQQQLQQMQTPLNGWQQNNGGFGAFPSSNVPQVPLDPTAVLLSNLLAQVQQQQQAQTAQQQPMNNDQQLLANLLQQLQANQNKNNSGGQ